jgi:hypothetical protein
MRGYKAMKKILTLGLLCISMQISADTSFDNTAIQTKLDTIIINVNSIKSGFENLLDRIKPFIEALKDTTATSASTSAAFSILPPSLTAEVATTPAQTTSAEAATTTPTNSVDTNNQPTTPPQEATLLTANESSEAPQEASNDSALVVNTPTEEMQPVDLSVQVNEAQPEEVPQDASMQTEQTTDEAQFVPTEEDNQEATTNATLAQEEQPAA